MPFCAGLKKLNELKQKCCVFFGVNSINMGKKCFYLL